MLATDVLESLGDGDLIPLADVAQRAGLNRGTQHYAIRHNVITPADRRGPNGRYLVTREQALIILAAGAIAVAVGVAVVTVIRTLNETGARVTSGALTIPLSLGK